MKRWFCIMIGSLLFVAALAAINPLQALGAPLVVAQKPKKKPKKPKATTTKNPREHSYVWGAGGRAGFLDSPVPSLGVQGYRWVTGLDQMGVLLAQGNVDLRSFLPDKKDIEITKARFSSSVFLLHGRRFFGETFSGAYGLGQRRINVDLAANSKVSNGGIDAGVTVNSWVLHGAVGNVWRWKSGYFLGCDWFGLMVPLSSQSSVRSEAYGAASAELDEVNQRANDVAKEISKVTSVTVLYLSTGIDF